LRFSAAKTPAGPERQLLRVKARAAYVKAHELGDNSQLVMGMIEGLPADGS